MTQHGRVAETRQSWITPAAEAPEIPDGIPGQGRPAELPGGRISGPSGDKDGDVGALTAPACPRNRGHYGGGNPPPHPRCTQFDMLVPRRALNVRHPATAQCTRGAEQKRRRLVKAEIREILQRSLKAYGDPLENVTTFR